MKIGLVYDLLFPYLKGGGERRYYELARRLADQHQVCFLSFGWWGRHPPVLSHPNISYSSVGRPVAVYTRNGKRSFAEALRFGAALAPALARGHFDVIDCCAFPYFSVLAARCVTAPRRIPLITTWFEYWGPYWFEYLGWKGALGRVIEDAALAASPRIISISAFTAARLNRNLLSRRLPNISIVPGGIDFEEIAGTPPLGQQSDVIYVGRLLAHKRVDLLIRSIQRLRIRGTRVQCIIVGDGPARAGLERLSTELGLGEAVRFLGIVPTASVYGLLKASKVFVSPSVREGFGIAVLEANACGLPVVVVRAPDNASAELVLEGVNGITCGPSAEAIADAIGILLSCRPERMHDDCTDYARKFDWLRIAALLSEVYEAALQGKPPPPGHTN